MNFSIEIVTSLIIGFVFGTSLIYTLLSVKIKKYKNQSLTDELTGLYNSREFDNRFKAELERAKRYKIAFSILLVDIDKFKNINDIYGYKMADKILQELAMQIQIQLRVSDVLFRYKMGDEFMIMALNTDKLGAERLAYRIKNKIENYNFVQENKISISVGISEFDVANPDNDMEKEAEQNLKADKLL